MTTVFSNIITTSTEDLVDSGALESFDVLLSGSDEVFHELQAELERDVSYVVLSLDAEDLQDKQFLVREIFRLICNEEASENSTIVENIEIIEEELAGTQSCILCLEDFFGCNEEAQAILLELVIVSQFKLLLGISQVPQALHNEKLWKVLLNRASWVDFSPASLNISEESSSEEKIEDEVFDAADDEFENDEDDFPSITMEDEDDESLSAHLRPESKARQQKQWYQMIPKYHLGAALILLLLVLALWNMDLTKTKQQSIDLNAETPAALDVRKPEAEVQMAQEQVQEQTHEQTSKAIELPIDAETISLKEKEKIPEETMTQEKSVPVVAIEQPKTSPPVEEVVEVVAPVVEKEIQKAPAKKTPVLQKAAVVDWSPYNSNNFIRGINKSYYTLQLVASHKEQGIRDFLKENGSNSNYAVYTTEKDGQPWHVIIYGVYETRESANFSKQDLPDYLKSYSPWVRSIADIQKSIQ